MPALRATLALALAGAALLALPAPAATSIEAEGRGAQQVFEVFSPSGAITRVAVPVPHEDRATAAELDAGEVVPLHVSGPSSNRFDIVIVGDGYTQDQLGLFQEHATDKWETIKATEPFTSYRTYFNVWLVNVASNESGVDNDPLPGTMKDTALDMQFWCQGTQRLLCMNQTKATQFANLAPEADQVLGLANSTKYGGAGGAYATSSGGNVDAGQITVHELGHSIGGLADEYDYYYRLGLEENAEEDVRLPVPYVIYPSALGEPGQYNITKSPSAEMAASKIKWWRWLGEASPDGTPVGTYEGGGYYKLGMYRPTETSLMRFLGHPFNLPGREKMTQSFYAHVDPIESAPPTSAPLEPGTTVAIEVLQPEGHELTIDWFLDGELVEDAHDARTFELPSSGGHAEVRVRVVDETPFVRDPAWIDEFLTQELAWQIA